MPEVAYPRLHKAVRWACKLHKDQDRDGEGALPYITHVMEVVSNLRYVGGIVDEDLLIVAALHDVIEQTGLAPEKIEKKFGRRVRMLVVELTREEPSAERTHGMRADKIWLMRSNILLGEIGRMSPAAQKVKLADRLSNIRNARATKIDGKLQRTIKQTEEILRLIPRRRNPGLWNAIRAELDAEQIYSAR